MLSITRTNFLRALTNTRAAAISQPRRFQTVWSHSTNEKVKTTEDIDTDKKAFNQEVTQEQLDEMKKHSDKFEQASTSDSKEHTKKYAEGFKDLKDKGKRTAEEQARPEDYM